MRRRGKLSVMLAVGATPASRRESVPGLSDIPARSWFNIHNAGHGTPTNDATRVDIYEEIGGWGVSAAEFVQRLRAIATPEVHLHVNSPGGSVFDGVAIFNALAQHPARVTAYVDGLAASAASFIVQAADEVIMNPGSMMMVHDAIGMTWGNAFDHHTMAGLLSQVSDSIAELYAMRAGGTAQSWRAVMEKDGGEGQWYTAEQAVEAGLADRVHGAAPTADEQAAADAPGDTGGTTEAPMDRYNESSIAAGHRLVLAQRDEALRMAPPPPIRRRRDAQSWDSPDANPLADIAAFMARAEAAPAPPPLAELVAEVWPDAIKLYENIAFEGAPPSAAPPSEPFNLAALAETMAAVERQPHTEDPFIPFQ